LTTRCLLVRVNVSIQIIVYIFQSVLFHYNPRHKITLNLGVRCLECELIILSQPFWNNAPTFFKSFNLRPYIIRFLETHTRKTCLAGIFPAKISSGILGFIYTSIFGGRFCMKLVRFQEHYYNSLYNKYHAMIFSKRGSTSRGLTFSFDIF
jgi:hypothetical protein